MKKLLWLLAMSVFLFGYVGKITALVGEAYVIRGADKLPLKLGSEIDNKDIILTSKNTKLQIMFKDDTIVTLGENSKFIVEDYFFEETKNEKNSKFKNLSVSPDNKKPNLKLRLSHGVMRALSGKIGKIAPQKFRIETKNVSIGIRGTYFAVKFQKNTSVVSVLEGKVFVIDKLNNKIFDLAGGETLILKASKNAKPVIKKSGAVNAASLDSPAGAADAVAEQKSSEIAQNVAANASAEASAVENDNVLRNGSYKAFLLNIKTPEENVLDFKNYYFYNSTPVIKTSTGEQSDIMNFSIKSDDLVNVDVNYKDAKGNTIDSTLVFEYTDNGFELKDIENNGEVDLTSATLEGTFYGNNAEYFDITKLSMITEYGNEYAAVPVLPYVGVDSDNATSFLSPYYFMVWEDEESLLSGSILNRLIDYADGIATSQSSIDNLASKNIVRHYEDGGLINFADNLYTNSNEIYTPYNADETYKLKDVQGKIEGDKLIITSAVLEDENGNEIPIESISSNVVLYSPNVTAYGGKVSVTTDDGKIIDFYFVSQVDKENYAEGIETPEVEVGYLYDADGNEVDEYIDGLQTSIDEINDLIDKGVSAEYSGELVGTFDGDKVAGTMNMSIDFGARSISGDMSFESYTVDYSGKINDDATISADEFSSDNLTINSGNLDGKFYGPHAESVAGHVNLETDKGDLKALYNVRR